MINEYILKQIQEGNYHLNEARLSTDLDDTATARFHLANAAHCYQKSLSLIHLYLSTNPFPKFFDPSDNNGKYHSAQGLTTRLLTQTQQKLNALSRRCQ